MIPTTLKALLHLAKVPRSTRAQRPRTFPCLGFTILLQLTKPGEGSICHFGCGQPSQLPEKATLGPGAREQPAEAPVLGASRGLTQGTQSQMEEGRK